MKTPATIDLSTGNWLNPPPRVALEPDRLEFDCAKGSDFWRRTHYGFTHASGHALLFAMPGNAAVELDVSARFTGRYEQAGLLLWRDAANWIKFGVEFADGQPNYAAVVTRDRSDWSMAPAAAETREFRLRLSATGQAIILHVRVAGVWQILRVTDFPTGPLKVGPMACAPLTEGFSAAFSGLRFLPLPEDPLYLGAG